MFRRVLRVILFSGVARLVVFLTLAGKRGVPLCLHGVILDATGAITGGDDRFRCVDFERDAANGSSCAATLRCDAGVFAPGVFLGGKGKWNVARGKCGHVRTEFRCIAAGISYGPAGI